MEMYLMGLHAMETWRRMFTDEGFRKGEGLDGTGCGGSKRRTV